VGFYAVSNTPLTATQHLSDITQQRAPPTDRGYQLVETPSSLALELNMSFRRATARNRPNTALELERRLVDELRTPSQQEGAQPIIIAEPPDPAPISRLFVIWDEWAELNLQERSEIIMNAYIAVFGMPAGSRITIAMGLTSTEAARMGIG
jgi:hypothetical protein